MKKLLSILGVLLLTALVVLPGAAQGEMYLEGYLGGNFAANAGFDFRQAHPGGPDGGGPFNMLILGKEIFYLLGGGDNYPPD